MKFAIPTANGELCQHFGHCEAFMLIDVEDNKITNTQTLTPPAHEPGVLPRWLGEKNVDVVIAGGMGQRAQELFSQAGIKVVIGAQPAEAGRIVESYLAGSLVTGENICDH